MTALGALVLGAGALSLWQPSTGQDAPAPDQVAASDIATATETGAAPEAAASDNGLPASDEAAQDIADSAAQAPVDLGPKLIRTSAALRSGDTLIGHLLSAGANNMEAHKAVAALRTAYNPRKLRAGQTIWTETLNDPSQDGKNILKSLEFDSDFGKRVKVIRAADDSYSAEEYTLPVETSVIAANGMIDDSLYLSAARENVPPAAIVNLIRIFSFNVDFQRDIWPGDRFAIVYENQEAQDGQSQLGDILYGELVLRGKPIELYRFTPPSDGRADYFDAKGRSARRLLMRTPIDGAHLTSRFGKRKHPVLGYTRMHTGLDFGAPVGTPIMASGDGIIERASRYGSYGNYVRIRHNGTYKTAYAHMSQYGKSIHKGARVKQGQIIGYVGATGRVTGPHLHYEVYVGKNRVNPLSLDLPTGKELKGKELQEFLAFRAQIDRIKSKTMVAEAPAGATVIPSAE